MKALKQGVKIALFSATMPPQILKVIKERVGEFRVIEDGAGEDEKPCVDQFYMVLRKEDRLEALKRVIDSAEDFYGLIFCATKAGVDELARRLTENGYPAEAIHGDLSQETREQTLRRFRTRRGAAGGMGAGPSILVATDVAARGLDIEKLTHVINWDLPNDRESYIHRIGRTGRAGRRGRAVSLVLPAQRGRMTQLSRFVEHALGSPVQWVKVPTVKSVMKTLRRRIAAGILDAFPEEEGAAVPAAADGGGERAGEQEAAAGEVPVSAPLEEEAFSPYIAKLARQLIEARGPERAVEALIASVYGGLLDPARYGEVKEFAVEDFAPRRKGATARGRPERGAVTSPRRGVKPGVRRGPRRRGFADSAAGNFGETRVYVGLGRKHGANAGDVARLLTRAGGVSGHLVDAIEMKDYCAFATMPRAAARRACAFSKNTPEDPVIHPAAWKE
jgi:ATP-dependent RNA helicase DeaD